MATKLAADVCSDGADQATHPQGIFADAAHGGLWRQPFEGYSRVSRRGPARPARNHWILCGPRPPRWGRRIGPTVAASARLSRLGGVARAVSLVDSGGGYGRHGAE